MPARRRLARLGTILAALAALGASGPAMASCAAPPQPEAASAAASAGSAEVNSVPQATDSSASRAATQRGVAAEDDLGRCVTLPTPARRIVTLTPHATELVYTAGGGDRLVGTVEHSDYPAAARALPRVGNALHLNPETLLLLHPDLVIAWQPSAMAGLEPALRAVGIPVFYSAPRRLADIPDNLDKLGVLMDTRPVAQGAARQLRQRLAELERRHAGASPVSVFIQVGTEPLYTLNDQHIVSDVLRVCGARNITGASPVLAPIVHLETVIAARPDIVLVPGDLPAATDYWRRYAPAWPVRLLGIDADLMYRPGPRLVAGAETLCERIDAVRKE